MKKIIDQLERVNLQTKRIAIARTCLAISALLLLAFNDINIILNVEILDLNKSISNPFPILNAVNIFNISSLEFGKSLSILILLVSIIGYFPQITIMLQTWVHLSICNSVIVIEGGDQIAANLCLLLIPICLLDNRKNHWQESNHNPKPIINIFSNIYFFIIKLQVAIIYLHAGAGKLSKADWLDGTCLYYWTTHNVFGAPHFLQPLYRSLTLSNFAPIFTWSVIIVELGLFSCLFVRDKVTREVFLVIGLAFHFGIWITHGLIGFFFAMAGALILYLDNDNSLYLRISKTYTFIKRFFKKSPHKKIKENSTEGRTLIRN